MAIEPVTGTAGYKDAKTRLVFVGVVEIVVAAICLLMLGATALARLVAPPQAAQPSLVSAFIMMGSLAAILLILGIGSVTTRRWARAVGLCTGWVGLVGGSIGIGFFAWMLPHMAAIMRAQSEAAGRPMPNVAVMIASVVLVAVTFFIYIVIPGTLVLCYRGENVRRTCEQRDATPRWTDRVPLPVLATLLMQAMTVAALLATIPTYGRACLVFGALVTGPAAIAIYVGLAAVFAYTAFGFYRMDRRAYWIYVAVLIVFALNSWVSFRGDGLMRMYRAIELPPAQLELLAKSPLIASGAMQGLMVASTVAMIAWAVWLKRYFYAPLPQSPAVNDSTL